jgi:FkbM family methyltransferase
MLESGYDSIFEKYKIDENTYCIKNYNKDEDACFRLYAKDLVISPIIRRGEIWEPTVVNTFEKYIKEDDVVLEGGAFIGLHSVKLSKLSNKLICFEPLSHSSQLLLHNLSLNNCKNVEVYTCGLGDKIETAKFDFSLNGNPGCSALEKNPGPINAGAYVWDALQEEKYNVPLLTIDSLKLDKLDFIKLDVEGYEPKIIKGGFKTIKKFRPIITLEWWYQEGIEDINTAFQSLTNIGYKIEIVDSCNYVFLP